MACAHCEDTGWRPIERDGVRRVERCDCWRSTQTSQLVADARIPPRYGRCDLENFLLYPNDELIDAVTQARRFVAAFPVVDKGLCLIGPPGIGKTHIAVAILRKVVAEKHARGLFYDVRDLLRVIRSMYNPVVRTAEMDILRPVMDAELLVLDDLGAEKPSEWVEETINLIVNTRYNERRPTIFTTNYEDVPDEANVDSLKVRVGFRLHSRLHEMCEFLEYDGGDYRMMPANGGADDLTTLWKRHRGRRTLPARTQGQARAEVRDPVHVRQSPALDRIARAEVAGGQSRTLVLGLYLHVPFCQAICTYCNFNRGLVDDAVMRRYVEALTREILNAGDARRADTVFFGGGTPSLLAPEDVGRLIDACRKAYGLVPGAEITLETNPETATPQRLRGFKDAGVNRISFGVQTFDDGELQRLGRVHTAARAAEAVVGARAAGFDNVSLDLMLWLPGQSSDSWRRTVQRAIDLDPDHLSLYLLELYPNAPLKESMARATNNDPGWVQAVDDAAADMYLDGLAALDRAGYEQYEISNVSKPGRQSRHNLKYWESGAWRGFGCGAHSTVDASRWHNVAGTLEYIERVTGGQSVASGFYERSETERKQEALFTGLRLSGGIDRDAFTQRFGVDPWMEYGEILAMHEADGFVWTSPNRFGLTRPGMLLANEILAAFV